MDAVVVAVAAAVAVVILQQCKAKTHYTIHC